MAIHDEIYKEFCEWSQEHAVQVEKYKPWGSTSIVVWLKNGFAYKVKRFAPNKFVMQIVSDEDIERKLGKI